MKKRSFPRLAMVAAAALVAASTFTSAIYADVNYTSLLALKVDWPQILFDNTGQTNYVADDQLLKIEADALFLQFLENDFPYSVVGDPGPYGIFKIRALVDHTGKLVGGIPPGDPNDACGGGRGDDFCVSGTMPDPFDATAPPAFAGVLLSGEVVNFASRDGGIGPDDFEFHIKITGGALKDYYPTGYLVVPVSSEVRPADAGPDGLPGTADDSAAPTPFLGQDSFQADFGGLALGTAGATDMFVAPLPPTCPPDCAPPTTCEDPGATNVGGPLPCSYPPPPPPDPTCPPDCGPPPCSPDCEPPPPPPPSCPPDCGPPPVVIGSGEIVDGAVTLEATGPSGAPLIFDVTATFDGLTHPVMCTAASGSIFGLGSTEVVCTTAPANNQTASLGFVVNVQDTTAPTIIGSNVDVEADGQSGHSSVPLPVSVSDLVDLTVTVVCDRPISGSAFTIGVTTVACSARDAAGNLANQIDIGDELVNFITVTVKANPPPLPDGEGCFVVDFREITYFKGKTVIASWPYSAVGGAGQTRSRGTLFRIYGFLPSTKDQLIPNFDNTFTTYAVKYDNDVKGYYIDLGGPARVMICAAQLHEYVLTGKKGNGHMEGSTLLPVSQQNVPGIMLTHNTQIVKVPYRVRWTQYQAGLHYGDRGVINYIGFQLQGNGNSEFREFVDVEMQFPGGFRTAVNTNFETFAGCNYVDHAPGNDAVRLRDVWGPNRSKNQGYESWQACGTREPAENQKRLNVATGLLERRANYIVPVNGVQILSTVNTNTDTLRLFYGAITKIPEKEMKKKDLKDDWREWDIWDR